MPDDDWMPGRWWRVSYAETRPGGWRENVWCETSNEQEARNALQSCPGGGVLLRLFVRTQREWREADRDA